MMKLMGGISQFNVSSLHFFGMFIESERERIAEQQKKKVMCEAVTNFLWQW